MHLYSRFNLADVCAALRLSLFVLVLACAGSPTDQSHGARAPAPAAIPASVGTAIATSGTKLASSRNAVVSGLLNRRRQNIRPHAQQKFLARSRAQNVPSESPEVPWNPGFRQTLWKPKGEPKGSIILLAPWAGEERWWVDWLGYDFNKLMKDHRVVEGVGRENIHENYSGWYMYDDWHAEVPLERDLDLATSFVHSLIEQEHRVVKSYHRIVLAGFSQGAVLALESGLRFPHPLGLVFSQRGRLLETRRRDRANLARTPYGMTAGSLDDVYLAADAKYDCQLLRKAEVPAFLDDIAGLDHYGRSPQENALLMKAIEAVLSEAPPKSIKSLASIDGWDARCCNHGC